MLACMGRFLRQNNIQIAFGVVLIAVCLSGLFLIVEVPFLWMGSIYCFNNLLRFMGNNKSRYSTTIMSFHAKCRNSVYPRSSVRRVEVPDSKVPWSVSFQEYKPVDYTAPEVLNHPPWADPEIRVKNPPVLQWNTIDKDINRRSHTPKKYEIHDRLPRNPIGRTGLTGRGLLGKWGPNHAADPIVTRWSRLPNSQIKKDKSGKKILQFLGVKRKDSGEWALPGGMVNVGEHISVTCKREFSEETMNSLEASDQEKREIEASVSELFNYGGKEIYKGYVDDPRNTDNAWMETEAFNFHDDNGKSVGKFKLQAGDDAVGVTWIDISSCLKLYASHNEFVRKVAQQHNASW